MNENDRKLALRQAKGKLQKIYVKELLSGPMKILGTGWYQYPATDSGISDWSRRMVNDRLDCAGFVVKTVEMGSGNKYLTLTKF